MRKVLALTMLLLSSLSVAHGDPQLVVDQHLATLQIAEVGQVGTDQDYEVSLRAGSYRSYASTWEEPQEASGVCFVSISRVFSRHDPEVPGSVTSILIDEACGEGPVTFEPLLGGVQMKATLSSRVTHFFWDGADDMRFDDAGESTIGVDLTLTGTDEHWVDEYDFTPSAFFCGFPGTTDMRGGGVISQPGHWRGATVEGSLSSAHEGIGAVPVDTLTGRMAEWAFAVAGACVVEDDGF